MPGNSLRLGQEVGIVLLSLCAMSVGSYFWFRYENRAGLITTVIGMRRPSGWTQELEHNANERALEYQFRMQVRMKRLWPVVALVAVTGVVLLVV